MDDVLQTTLTAIFTALVPVLGALGGMALNELRKSIGAQYTNLLIQVIEQSLANGIAAALSEGATTKEAAAKAAVQHAKISIPETISKATGKKARSADVDAALLNIAKAVVEREFTK